MHYVHSCYNSTAPLFQAPTDAVAGGDFTKLMAAVIILVDKHEINLWCFDSSLSRYEDELMLNRNLQC